MNALDKFDKERARLELLLMQSNKPIHTMLQFDGSYYDAPRSEGGGITFSHGETKELRNTAEYSPLRVYINPNTDKELIADLLNGVCRIIYKEYLYKPENLSTNTNDVKSETGSIDDDLPFSI